MYTDTLTHDTLRIHTFTQLQHQDSIESMYPKQQHKTLSHVNIYPYHSLITNKLRSSQYKSLPTNHTPQRIGNSTLRSSPLPQIFHAYQLFLIIVAASLHQNKTLFYGGKPKKSKLNSI